jgi:HSP20 family protein
MLQFELKPAAWQHELNEFFGNRDQVLPACEIIDSPEAFTVTLDVPGFKREDIELELKDRHLHIVGTRKAPELGERARLLRQERRFGKFHRAFALPDGIDEQHVTARFTDGVLSITLPKTAIVGRKIVVS